jgi:hypothetical protein
VIRAFHQGWEVIFRIVGGGGRGGPTGAPGMSATEWPVVPDPVDCDDGEFGGMKIGRGN